MPMRGPHWKERLSQALVERRGGASGGKMGPAALVSGPLKAGRRRSKWQSATAFRPFGYLGPDQVGRFSSGKCPPPWRPGAQTPNSRAKGSPGTSQKCCCRPRCQPYVYAVGGMVGFHYRVPPGEQCQTPENPSFLRLAACASPNSLICLGGGPPSRSNLPEGTCPTLFATTLLERHAIRTQRHRASNGFETRSFTHVERLSF